MERGASDKDVKRAYRQLSLQYHPDKNPDPEAGRYFAESITKAYKALTGQHCTISSWFHGRASCSIRALTQRLSLLGKLALQFCFPKRDCDRLK